MERARGQSHPHEGEVAAIPGGNRVPGAMRARVKFGEWLTGNHVSAVEDGRLSPAAHQAKRERYLQLLAETRRGVPHFQLRTGEELRDDLHRYLLSVWGQLINYDWVRD